MTLKLVYDRKTARLLGGQAFGRAGVEKRVDVLAAALHAGQTLHDLAEIDLSYAPPYSSANDPVNIAAFVGQNDISGFGALTTAEQLSASIASGRKPFLLDVRTLNEFERGRLKGAVNIPVDQLRYALESIPRDVAIAVYCRGGYRAHLALRILKENGFASVVNVTGGYLTLDAFGGFEMEAS